MITTEKVIEKVNGIDIVERQMQGTKCIDYLLQQDGRYLFDEKKVLHVYFSLSIARYNARNYKNPSHHA